MLNFISYVSAKYYLNLSTVGKVIAKTKRVNFLRQSYALLFVTSIGLSYVRVFPDTQF